VIIANLFDLKCGDDHLCIIRSARGVLSRVHLALSPCVLVVPWNCRPLWGEIPAGIDGIGGW
jgi:hypothetical protein